MRLCRRSRLPGARLASGTCELSCTDQTGTKLWSWRFNKPVEVPRFYWGSVRTLGRVFDPSDCAGFPRGVAAAKLYQFSFDDLSKWRACGSLQAILLRAILVGFAGFRNLGIESYPIHNPPRRHLRITARGTRLRLVGRPVDSLTNRRTGARLAAAPGSGHDDFASLGFTTATCFAKL